MHKKINMHESYGAFPLCGATLLGTVQNGTVRFAYLRQFSTALEWAALFTSHYICDASTAVTPEKRFHSASLLQALA